MTKRVLIIEEDPEYRDKLSIALKEAGCKTTLALNIPQAINCIFDSQTAGERFDLIVTELKFSEVSAVSLFYGLRKNGISIPVLVTSGFIDKSTITDLVYCGIADLIIKPFMPDDFVRRVDNLIVNKFASANNKEAAFGLI